MVITFMNVILLLEWPFDSINQTLVEKLLTTVVRLLHMNLDYADYTRVKHWIIVAYFRAKNLHHVTVRQTAFADKIYSIVSKQPIKLIMEKTLKIKVTKDIVEQLLAGFINSNFIPNYESLEESSLEDQKIRNSITILDQSLAELSEIMNIPLLNKEDIILDLYNIVNLLGLLNKGKLNSASSILFSQKKLFVQQMKQEFPEYTSATFDMIDETLDRTNTYLNRKGKNEVFYILTIGWKGLIPALIDQEEKTTVMVISRYDQEHAEMIQDVMNQHFHGTVSVELYDKMQLTPHLLEGIEQDLIITTFSLGTYSDKPSVVINSYPTKKDLRRIQEKIDTIKLNKSTNKLDELLIQS
ncbi:M protein trans-acting positive regulator PRD domain-containing protein [Marinilactibacillus sp. GCM10026970]|uniref:M protein trans-acting positive regulator PRD domain-containing protein n=1 Tax=Marinilactibacillus sp. GCM10026970 TaxID=3252642 RepID=UPI003619C0E8